MTRILLLALALLAPSGAGAQTLLYKNPCPAPALTDATYLAGIANIIAAIDAGKRIHLSMSYAEGGGTSHFAVEITAIKATATYASGLLPMRPPINNYPEAVSATGQFVGSADTQGYYVWGDSRNGASVNKQSCYENAWWAY